MPRYTAIAWLVGVLACGGSVAPVIAQPERLERVVIGLADEPPSLDASNSASLSAHNVSFYVTETLLKRDRRLNLVTSLAAAPPRQVDRNTWEVEIRKGVKFHGGAGELSADSVKFSLNRLRAEKLAGSFLFAQLEPVEVIDKYKIRIRTKGPLPVLPALLALPQAAIHPAGKYETRTAAEMARAPIGTGPFQLVEWTPKTQIRLERFDGYWAGRPMVKELVFRPVTDATDRAKLLRTGELHIAQVSRDDLAAIAQDSKLERVETPSTSTVQLLLYPEGPLQDRRVRQALASTIDVAEIVKTALGSKATPAQQIAGPFYFGFDRPLVSTKADIASGKKLLTDAGVAGQVRLTLSIPPTDDAKTVASVLQSQLRQIGVIVEIKSVERTAYVQGLAERKLGPAVLVSAQSPTFDAGVLYHRFFHSQGPVSPWKVASLDAAIDRAMSTMEQAERAKALSELNRMIRDETVGIPLYQEWRLHGKRRDLRCLVQPDGVVIVQAGPGGSCDCDNDADCCKTQDHCKDKRNNNTCPT